MQPVLPNICSLFYPKQMQPVLPNKCSLFYLTNAACFTQPMQTVLPNKCSLFYPTNAACYTQPMVYQNRYVSGWLHCPKNNMNLCIKAKLNVPGADATVYMLYMIYLASHTRVWRRNQTYSVECSRDSLGFYEEN